MFNNNLQLQGKFRFSVYDKNDELKSSTDYVDNFITNSGLTYPFFFNFADCFRYLSVGTSNQGNSIHSTTGTTGLYTPITASGYAYIGGGGACRTAGVQETPNKYVTAGCGYRINPTGVTLSRAWRIPDNANTFFPNDTLVREYMISPGSPARPAWVNSVFTNICDCNEFGYEDDAGSPSFNLIYGHEAEPIASYYKNTFPICTATKAFTRVVKDISVLTDEYLVVNYSLDVTYRTGIRSFNLAITNTSRDSAIGQEFGYNWVGQLSGISSLIHPGINLINDGSFQNVASVNDIWGGSTVGSGESFVPPLGNPMEPSLSVDQRASYISSDNVQFIVNDLSGGAMATGLYYPYNGLGRQLPSGTEMFHKNWINETTTNLTSTLGDKVLGADPSELPHFVNIRTDKIASRFVNAGNYYADQTDFKGAPVATVNGFTPRYLMSKGNSIVKQPYTNSDRNRSIIINNTWKDATLPSHFPVRSFVFAYRYLGFGETAETFSYGFPFFDVLFAPKTGKLAPLVNTGTFKYLDPYSSVASTNTSGHHFMDETNILQLQFRIAWSSPCSSTVDGCP